MVWAELFQAGAKCTKKQNLARMARRKPFFETLRKLLWRRSAEGNSVALLRDLLREMEYGGVAKRTEVRGGQKLLSVGGSHELLPPLFYAPPFGVLLMVVVGPP